jgi:hypothetical protein
MRLLAGLLLILSAVFSSAHAQAPVEVDLALVLAVDIAGSMDPEEQALQREGFVDAFRSPLIHDAIRDGSLGRIAVVYLEWAGTPSQQVAVPWTIIEGSEGANTFADQLERSRIWRAPRTSLSGAIDRSVKLLEESRVEPVRRVIDISGDGANNQARFSTLAESRLYRSWGCDVIGMTNMPEAKLAREAELCYAPVAMVTDYDSWHADYGTVDVSKVTATLLSNAETAKWLVVQLASELPREHEACPIGSDRALEHAIITAPAARDRALLDKLDAVAGRVVRAQP